MKAVSYTHLDVYKRQVQYSRPLMLVAIISSQSSMLPDWAGFWPMELPALFSSKMCIRDRDKAFLSEMGEVFYLGDVKAACAFKLITNLIGLSNNVILTEGVFLAKRMGLSEEAFLNGAKSTGAWSYQMWNSGHKVFNEAFLPMRGTLDNAWKDMKFGVEMAEEAGVSCPAFAMLRDRYKAASEAGYLSLIHI